jgi:nitrogen fixation/metabolism regulation signal transduction histidine kinase
VIRTRGDGPHRVHLYVEDNGPGFPAEVRERLFTPYVTTKQRKGGSGLGLAIIHRIISDHGGTIEVGDAAGGGARIDIVLPTVAASSAPRRSSGRSAPGMPTPRSSPSRSG